MSARTFILPGIVAMVLVGLFLAAFMLDETARDVVLVQRLMPPLTNGALLGTDQLGRDMLARVLAGAPWSLMVAAGASAIAIMLGGVLGLVAAERGGLMRRAILQLANLAMSFPGLVAAIITVSIFGQSAASVSIVLGLMTWALFTRVVYAESLEVRARDYVVAADLSGVSTPRRLMRHVVPALAPSLMVLGIFHFADMLVAASALSFLGVGAPLGAPAWGAMLSESRPYLYQAPWMLLAPAIALAGTVLALNMVGDYVAGKIGVNAS